MRVVAKFSGQIEIAAARANTAVRNGTKKWYFINFRIAISTGTCEREKEKGKRRNFIFRFSKRRRV